MFQRSEHKVKVKSVCCVELLAVREVTGFDAEGFWRTNPLCRWLQDGCADMPHKRSLSAAAAAKRTEAEIAALPFASSDKSAAEIRRCRALI